MNIPLFFISILTVQILFPTALQADNSANNNHIYGVRWFLGDSFAYAHQGKSGNNYYILAFNTEQIFKQDVYV